MNKLEECRKRIDDIDSKIIKLFEERMDVVKEVTSYKLENDLPVLDASRESRMLEKNLNRIKNDEYKEYYEDVLLGFLKASKAMQNILVDEAKNGKFGH